jgi:integrase
LNAYWVLMVERVGVGQHRTSRLRKDLNRWLDSVGLPYFPPHAFRRGHASYGLANSRTVADYKAVSENLMHSSLAVTDEIYAEMADKNVRRRIGALGIRGLNGQDQYKTLEARVARLESGLAE